MRSGWSGRSGRWGGGRRGNPRRRNRWQQATAALLICVLVSGSLALFGAAGGTDRSVAAAAPATSASAFQPTSSVTSAGYPVSAVQLLAPATTVATSTLISGGILRTYLTIAPSRRSGPLPLIVVLAGQNASPTQEALRDELLPLANRGEAILVYPAGYQKSWNVDADSCCGQAGPSNVDDVGFVADVVAAAESSQSVTSGRVYLAGYSNGGKLAYDVMCREPQLFAAFAAVSATPLTSCAASSHTSALVVVGADDPELPISTDAMPAGAALAAAAIALRTRDACSATSTSVRDGLATITSWSSCSGGTAVSTVLYTGQEHGWPTTSPSTPGAALLLWRFFNRTLH
ncbi:poly(3-hydroxybutyrate) depolymerase [Jatrophihabitans sp. GAS493]|uniref:alpha/beta hydrolase family esterase n=1 Tax=Jatrophihabitans sp. GAS493 TaxID=1907575 RepID=UPI000BC035F3|nr:PHB depolymerase family esterase [Jatrophihabitans sp. GAS493]SOD71454.1 poly(3-hydroxybutyrate) depolymerase [Jatrophihabitans sp. GAS493]